MKVLIGLFAGIVFTASALASGGGSATTTVTNTRAIKGQQRMEEPNRPSTSSSTSTIYGTEDATAPQKVYKKTSTKDVRRGSLNSDYDSSDAD